MYKIQMKADKDTNYVFHMLSVARCGYDNAYGERYRKLYPKEDIDTIKENEELLTVCGGQHCGELYGCMVAGPACGNIPAKEYYSGLIGMTENGQAPANFLKFSMEDNNRISADFHKYAETVRRISAVMVRHYDHYIRKIWPEEEKKIQAYIPRVLPLFEEKCFTDKAEELVGCSLPGRFFTAMMVTSVANGAEAIDISDEQDVFGIERDPVDAFYFIGHEFIIYLLLRALKDENAFHSFQTWGLTEGLAEYYLKKIMGDFRFFDSQQKYALRYEQWEKEGKRTAVELYRMGLQAEGIG